MYLVFTSASVESLIDRLSDKHSEIRKVIRVVKEWKKKIGSYYGSFNK